jgi:hypothetical protein
MTYYSFDGAFQNLNSAIDGIGKRLQEQRDTEANLAAFDAWQRQTGQTQPQQPVGVPARSPLLSLGRGDDYFGRTASAESSGDPNARNPRSSATGLHQFLKGTWAGLMKSNPELGLTEDGRTDPEQSNRAMRAFTAQNADALRAKGVEPNDRNLYMAHFLGAGAAPNFIGAVQQDPSVPAASLVSAQVAAANRPVFFNRDGSPKTAGEVYERMTGRFGSESTAIAALGGGQPAPVQVAQAGSDARADLPPQGTDAGQAQGFAIPGAQPMTRQNSAPMVRALIANPGTRALGMQLWQSVMTGKNYDFQVVGDQLYRVDKAAGTASPVGITNPKAQLEMEGIRADIALKNKQLNATKDRQSIKGEDGALYSFDPQTGSYTRQIEGGPKSEEITSLRKEVQNLPSYKNIAQAAPIYKSMLETAGRDSKASDLNLVYGLGKIMDPTSVVREGEMVMVRNSAGLTENLIGAINSLNGGAALTPQTRQALMQEAHSRMQSYKDMFDQDTAQYDGIIKRRGMNRADVLPTFGEFKAYERKGVGGTPGQAGSKPTPVKPGSIPVPPSAVRALQSDPSRAAEFDAKYGAGMSERLLRGN